MDLIWKKRYGQHLLHDKNIIKKIITSLNVEKDDRLIEIGSGSGALTEFLLNYENPLTLFEIDNQFFELLKSKISGYPAAHLIEGDFLKIDLEQYFDRKNKTIIVGNLPYNITSQIIFKLINFRKYIKSMVFTIQLEVAKRIISAPRTKDRGILSVVSQFFFEPKLLFNVKRNSFFPIPNVDSGVIELKMNDHGVLFDSEDFFKVVKTSFSKRRKTLKNNLLEFKNINLEMINEKINLEQRPEELEVSDFITLTKLVMGKK